MGTVTISVERYEELLKKEAVYDIKRFDVLNENTSFLSDKVMFGYDLSANATAIEEEDF